jgi:predicted transcriptional regulator/DNA-binding XRE family transcriptional regulator
VAQDAIDSLILGHRVRFHRQQAGLTLDQLGKRVGKPASYLSMLENGKREPRLGLINALAAALEVGAAELLTGEAPSKRSRLEIRLVRAQQDPIYQELGLPVLKPQARVPDIALEHILALFDELKGRSQATMATREEARIANSELRAAMRERGNYFSEIEQIAAQAVAVSGYAGGGFTEGTILALAAHFGFTVHRARELPSAVLSLTDLRNRRIYIPQRDAISVREGRSVVLQTIGHFALNHAEPSDFATFLRQRVEANYFAGATLMPEVAMVPLLHKAKTERTLAVEDLRDAFYVSYEMAAHRFTNLATRHLDLRVHFVRSDELGIIWKAYENNGVPFPRNSVGAIEGQRLCREWGTRQAFRSEDRYSIHYQYTDTSQGTFWCSTRVDETRRTLHAITVGVRFDDARYFRGRETTNRSQSHCPDGICCRRPGEDLAAHWEGWAYPSVRPNSHVLAAMPVETFPGVDTTEIYEFLDRHSADT